MNSTKALVIAASALLSTTFFLTPKALAQDEGRSGPIREFLKQRQLKSGQDKPAPTDVADALAKITAPGDYTFTIVHDNLTRTYRVHVPAKYKPTEPTPMLIAFHGGGANMDYQASDENYGQISMSEREGFIVVFPNGFSRLPGGKLATWNAGNCCGPARDRNVDDVGFVRQMIENLARQLNIDRKRIFATGMSNGGLMVHRLACEMSDTFRAVAAVAGTDNSKACSPKNPIAVMQIHAKNDDHVPFNGGAGPKSMGSAVTTFTSVPESISRWVKRDGCDATPKRVLERPGAYCDRYSQCQGGVDVELCVTDSGAHSWPGASKSRSSEPPSKAISANDVMWDFFMSR